MYSRRRASSSARVSALIRPRIGDNAHACDAEAAAQPVDHGDQRRYIGGVAWPHLRAHWPRIAVDHPRKDHLPKIGTMVLRVIGLEAPVDVDGAAIMGYPWTPKSPFDVVRVKVVVPAWTNRPTSIVVALFVNQTVIPSKVASQELAPGEVGEAVLEFEMVPAGTEPINSAVRVGPGRSGSIYLNGNANGPDPDMPKPTFTIEEYRPFWR